MINPSIFKAANSKAWFLFSAWPLGRPSIYISELTSPTSIGPATLLSQPTLAWEQVDTGIKANPVGISRGGLEFITFSASLCSTSSVSLGLLTLRKEDWMVFHANRKESGVCDGNRQAMAQRVNWGSDGKMDLGVPLPLDVGLLPPSGEEVGSLL
ncbi:hypothetical protein B0J14DRAFT_562343 [Halenospora varia]|nr:hypothetical protein B0J14DRAFT_562343 [Halenospora varia]